MTRRQTLRGLVAVRAVQRFLAALAKGEPPADDATSKSFEESLDDVRVNEQLGLGEGHAS